ncbi:hypothetical protein [Hydrococcus rivularis]|nr:hypothetical protein [Hydrococcus rivularis]
MALREAIAIEKFIYMLVFVIPLKSPQVSRSWERVCQLFERTVRSACNQTSPNFHVIVVCHEKPNIEFTHPKITYLEVDFPLPKETNPVARGDTDKGRKILKGLIYAAQFSPSHTMAVDADDCVSQHLAEFVEQYPQNNGWYVSRGYKYQENTSYVYLTRKNFYRMCGTSNILRYDLNFLPENPEYNRGYGYYKYYILHARVRDVLTEKGMPLAPLPFAGAIYILGYGDNVYGNAKNFSFNFFNRRKLTKSIREEFCLSSIV